MMKYIKPVLCAVVFFAYNCLFALNEFPIASANDIVSLEDGWMKISGGDPYLVFNCSDTSVEDFDEISIYIEGHNVRNRHSYVELFWASNTHGFSEQFKGFYIHQFPVKSGLKVKDVINFKEFIDVMEENGDHIRLLRIDFEKELKESDFLFKCEIHNDNSVIAVDDSVLTKAITLHPQYQSKYLYRKSLSKYVLKNIFIDFIHKFSRDWLFLLLYFGSVSGISILLFYILRRKNPWQVD